MGLHYYHIMLDFCEMNSVYEGIFWVLLFGKYFLGGFLLVAKYFLGRLGIPNSADPCLWVFQVHPLGKQTSDRGNKTLPRYSVCLFHI